MSFKLAGMAMMVGMAADDYCYLITTGRRSGRPHRIEIWYAAEGDTLYLLSGGGRRADWVRNLAADPSVRVELRGEAHDARARILDGTGAEERRARALVHAKYAPRSVEDLEDWRDRALPVAVDLTG
ncbi:MAG: nitroreductase family deazaflavin-dependent oxidoreductase [Acidimicrobiales bacterium]